ncbi:MAG: GntR family transcriptional regulator [Planctomycetes bacterium]|nr:GntR family transcriptional regulator [Planctomycetota bacterium]
MRSQSSDEHQGPQREQAYSRLRQLLILHQAPEGKRLNEETWANRLEVNRAALREAFARLEAEGLIEKRSLPGYFVPQLTAKDVSEICEVRIILEGGAIDRICRQKLNTPKHLAPLRETCEQLAGLADGGDYTAIAQAVRSFHECLIKVAKNRRLAVMYLRAPLPIIPPDAVGGREWQTRVNQTVQEHRQIVEHMLQGDAVKARSTLRVHLREHFHIHPRT